MFYVWAKEKIASKVRKILSTENISLWRHIDPEIGIQFIDQVAIFILEAAIINQFS